MNRIKINSSKKILVVGDAILDKYIFGDTNRISPEAPVPVLHVKNKEFRCGGALNVASSISSLGQFVSVLAITGEDEEANQVIKLLKQNNIHPCLLKFSDEHTIVKQRILAKNQQLLRIDNERKFKKVNSQKLFLEFKNIVESYDLVVLSDYSKGTLDNIQEFIIYAKKCNIPIYIDPKGNNFEIYRGATCITPNLKEFEAIIGKSDNEKQFINKALKLKAQLKLENLVVTLGAEGVFLVDKSNQITKYSSNARSVFDVSGAGDTVIGILSCLVANDYPIINALFIANIAAGIAVGKVGTSIVTREEIDSELRENSKKNTLVTNEELLNILDELKSKNKSIVMTNGCFDILHIGHLDYLQKAKDLGDVLIVAINSDYSVKLNKGNSRPINNEKDRAKLLCSLNCVDFVVVFNEKTPLKIYEAVLPNILVKGADYNNKEIVGADVVIKNGGRVELMKYIEGYSSSSIINKIKSLVD